MEFNKICENCGGVNPENADRCLNCGGEIRKLSPEELALFLSQKKASVENNDQLETNVEMGTTHQKVRNEKTIDFQISTFHRGTRWLRFYIFILLPIRIGFGVLSLLAVISVIASQAASEYAGLSLLLSLLDLGLTIVTYNHIKKLKKEGYLYNILWLFGGFLTIALPNAIVNTTNGTEGLAYNMLVQCIAYALAILLPNFIYFYKRRELFNDPLTKSDEEIFDQKQNTPPPSPNYHLDGTLEKEVKTNPIVAPLPDEPAPQQSEPVLAIPEIKENASEATVVPKLTQLKGKKPKQKKNTFCKRCGSLIDSATKKCSGCGRQYFKIRFSKKVYPVVSLILILGLAGGLIYQNYYFHDMLEQKDGVIDFKQSMIDSLRDDVDKLESEQESAAKILKLSIEKAAFLDKYIAIIETGNVYHKHGCEELDENSSFIAYNIKIAEAQGYKPCPKCHSDK